VTCGVAAEGGSGGQHRARRRRKVSGGARCHAAREKKIGEVESGHVGCCGYSAGVGCPKAQCSFLFLQNYSNGFELIRSKDRISVLENFQIKYGIEWFEERNNFPYRNFSEWIWN
jgi:hypothetical protein